jgi:hypothetical protein
MRGHPSSQLAPIKGADPTDGSTTHSPVGSNHRYRQKDYLIAKEELNCMYKFRNKELYTEYLLYNLNSKPISFDMYFILLTTLILLPIRVLYFVYFNTSLDFTSVTYKALNIVILVILVLVALLGWIYIFERQFPKNRYFKKVWRSFRFLMRRKPPRIGVLPPKSASSVSTTTTITDFADDDEDDESEDPKHLFHSKKNVYTSSVSNPNDANSWYHMRNRFSYLQHFLVLMFMFFNILIFITNCIQENCTDYHNDFLNHLLRNCPPNGKDVSHLHALLLMVTPLFLYCAFREILFELHCVYHLTITITAILYISHYEYSVVGVLIIIGLSIGTFCLLIDLHIHNVAAFLTNHQLREILLEKERNADKQAALEMRHMIGNVAHDLKTVS